METEKQLTATEKGLLDDTLTISMEFNSSDNLCIDSLKTLKYMVEMSLENPNQYQIYVNDAKSHFRQYHKAITLERTK